MTILNVTIIIAAISIAAGSAIPVWGFAIFAFLVAAGAAILSFAGGTSLIGATIYSIGILVLMEVSYLIGLFLSGLWRRTRKVPKNGSAADPARATSKHRQN